MKQIYQKHTREHKEGFTLIELIVSVALFTIILTVALGSLLMVIDANRQAKAMKLVVNNLNLAMEGMSRELRVGSNICSFDNSNNAPNPSCNDTTGSEVVFFTTDQGEESSLFRLADDAVERRVGPSGGGNTALQLTGSDVIVDELLFYIRGVGMSGTEADEQPTVTIVMNGHIDQADQVITFNVQTTVSQRKLEL